MGVENEYYYKIKFIGERIGAQLTDEQIDFASDFTKPTVSFSDPGSGKSTTTVVGLIMAQTYRGVAGSKINAMSFTNAATAELAQKYRDACKAHGMTPTVQFNTFHSICNSIVREEYPQMKIQSVVYAKQIEDDVEALSTYMEELGYDTLDKVRVKKVLETINSLNSSLTYERYNVEKSYKFKEIDMDFEDFSKLRVRWLLKGLVTMEMSRGDIPVYALYALCRNPKLRQKYLAKYKIMVVDEFQDLSLLHLKILSMICDNLVAIGDMKQQIYAFNGASQQIVEEYLKLYPTARRYNLTRSFRCKDEIAEYATSVIRRNDLTVKTFNGTGSGGHIEVIPSSQLNLEEIVASIKKEQMSSEKAKKDVMFLFRNNVSAIPLAEVLYREKVRFRMPKFLPVYSMPIYKDLCTLVDAAICDKDSKVVAKALRLFPEFKKLKASDNIILCTMMDTGCSLFSCLNLEMQESSRTLLKAMLRAKGKVERKAIALDVFDCIMEEYGSVVMENKWWTLPKDREYYSCLISPIVTKYDYEMMMLREIDKLRYIEENESVQIGVRCYTVHVGKGLEADDIYILDADEGVFPNKKMIKKYIQAGCEFEAAKEIRNERNLLYVALTRAKSNITVCYDKEVTSLLSHPMDNEYCYLDAVYEATNKDFDDVDAFMKLFKIGKYDTKVNL